MQTELKNLKIGDIFKFGEESSTTGGIKRSGLYKLVHIAQNRPILYCIQNLTNPQDILGLFNTPVFIEEPNSPFEGCEYE